MSEAQEARATGSKIDLPTPTRSAGLTAVITLSEIAGSVANATSLINWSSAATLILAIAGMVVGALLHLAGTITSKALAVIVLVSAGVLGFGLMRVYAEQGPPARPPFLLVKAFKDIDNDGVRGTYERFVNDADRILVTFTPELKRSENRMLDGSALFNNFDAGETVTVSICGIDKEVRTFPKDSPDYVGDFALTIPLPTRFLEACTRTTMVN